MYQLFSVDDHILEHGSVWTDRLPAKYREVGPHLVVDDDGTEWWEYEDVRGATTGLNAVAGKPPEFWNLDPLRFSEMIPSCYDPKARAKDFLANGILASVGFPTLPRFGGVLFQTFRDKELAGLCVEAYNDFVLEEWCPGGPDTPWPFTQEEVTETLAGLAQDEVEAITHGNAERLFGWTMADPELALKAEPVKPFQWQEGQLHQQGERAVTGTGGHRGAHYQFRKS